jgi:hypothetical protein
LSLPNQPEGDVRAERSPVGIELGFLFDDVPAAYQRGIAARGTSVSPPAKRPWGRPSSCCVTTRAWSSSCARRARAAEGASARECPEREVRSETNVGGWVRLGWHARGHEWKDWGGINMVVNPERVRQFEVGVPGE